MSRPTLAILVACLVAACDPGSNDDDDLTTADPECGNGILEEEESCDEGIFNGRPNRCDAACSAMTAADCGNGIVEAGEACDDGIFNGDPGACAQACEGPTPPRCGDGVLDEGEACDDGNTMARDGCSLVCIDEGNPCKFRKVGQVNGEGILSARMVPGRLAVLGKRSDPGMFTGFYISFFDVSQPATPLPGPTWYRRYSEDRIWAMEVEDLTLYKYEGVGPSSMDPLTGDRILRIIFSIPGQPTTVNSKYTTIPTRPGCG